MYFPKFWAKAVWRGADRDGKTVAQDAWGWSDVSQADARQKPRNVPASWWVTRYDAARRAFAVCRFVRTIGTAPQHPAVASIVAEHDRLTGATSTRPLA